MLNSSISAILPSKFNTDKINNMDNISEKYESITLPKSIVKQHNKNSK